MNGSATAQNVPGRADARRNRDRLLVAAELVVARDGTGASLEKIAREAGVGSATLHRHFRSRHALLQELFRHRIATLCARAAELADSDTPGDALVLWLREVARYVASTRGLAESMRPGLSVGHADDHDSECFRMVSAAGTSLLERAQATGEIRHDARIDDLLTLISAVSLVSERNPDAARTVDRVLMLSITGLHANATQ